MNGSLLAEEIEILRETIRANDGANVASGAFTRRVDQLISAFYDDIDHISGVSLEDILDLFLIKVLYVERHSRDAGTLSYLGRMMRRLLRTSELDLNGRGAIVPYLTDLLQEASRPGVTAQSLFESYRKYGDNALFLSGLFPDRFSGRKRGMGRMGGAPLIDRSYVIAMGRRYYEMAGNHRMADWVHLRPTLLRLARFFDVYVDALNELGGRYVLGIDMQLLADKMLDALNRYRASGQHADLQTARAFAALLRLDGHAWPALAAAAEPDYY
jgi:hypothetical protein